MTNKLGILALLSAAACITPPVSATSTPFGTISELPLSINVHNTPINTEVVANLKDLHQAGGIITRGQDAGTLTISHSGLETVPKYMVCFKGAIDGGGGNFRLWRTGSDGKGIGNDGLSLAIFNGDRQINTSAALPSNTIMGALSDNCVDSTVTSLAVRNNASGSLTPGHYEGFLKFLTVMY